MRDEIAARDRDFLTAVFTPAEISHCRGHRHPERAFAARFAAKEAVVKALAAAGGRGMFWLDVEIPAAGRGGHRAVLHDRAREMAGRMGVRRVHVSLAHSGELALAGAVLAGPRSGGSTG